MQAEATPRKTPMAREWITQPRAPLDLVTRVLLSVVDGRRHLVELESFARALGLREGALYRLRAQGLIQFADIPPAPSKGCHTRSLQSLGFDMDALKEHA